jgi:hypothetical protein
MAIGQRETGCTVIEDSRSPGGNRMARGTLRRRGWKSGRDVIRYRPAQRRRAQESRLVASITVRRTEGVVVIHMAGGAGRWRRGHVRSGQGKPGGAVIETRRCPTYRCMAYGAVRCRKLRTRRGVHRIICLLPGRQMASRVPAIGRGDRQSIVVVDVARSAGHVGMAIGQRKPGRAVVKSCRRPTHRRMAQRTVRCRKRRTRRGVHRIVRLLPGR